MGMINIMQICMTINVTIKTSILTVVATNITFNGHLQNK